MMSKFFRLLYFSLFLLAFGAVFQIQAQTRKAVSGAEATGTFRDYFSGKFKGNYNEIKILALGKGKLKVSFDLTYPHRDAQGEMTANMGSAEGEATISGDTAVYKNSEYGECKIMIKFIKPGTIKVSQEGTDGDCGFGFNVNAGGTYKKVSGAKPKF